MALRGPQPMHCSDPIKLGDAHNVVAEIALDRDGLEWLEGLCPDGDGFTEDLRAALRELDERERFAEEFPPWGLSVVLVGELRDDR